jgi:hypothetical protein
MQFIPNAIHFVAAFLDRAGLEKIDRNHLECVLQRLGPCENAERVRFNGKDSVPVGAQAAR